MIILDGGMSRELQRVGAPFRQPEWSALALIEAPEKVEQVHREFAEAGADVVTTNSYALVPYHIGAERFAAQGAALARLAGELARSAANGVNARQPGRAVRVAGSLPPVNGSYRPDLFDAAQAREILAVLIAGLRGNVDLWLAETLSSIIEAQTVTALLQTERQPVWVSFTLDDSEPAANHPPRLRSGELVREAAAWAASAGIETLLFNCSQPEVMAPALEAAQHVLASLPSAPKLGVYANAFVAHDDEVANETLAEIREDLDMSHYADFAAEWAQRGAFVVGGCCGIGTRHIHALSRRLRAEPVPSSEA